MSWLTLSALYIIHVIYWVANTFSALRNSFVTAPRPIDAPRKQVPKHLALLFDLDTARPTDDLENLLIENVRRAVSWCRLSGINRLTVYDRKGLLLASSLLIRERILESFSMPSQDSEDDSELEYPLTPPLTDESDSRSLSPEHVPTPDLFVSTFVVDGQPHGRTTKRRNSKTIMRRRHSGKVNKPKAPQPTPVTLHIICRKSGKPAVASFADCLARRLQESGECAQGVVCSIDDITFVLEGEHGFPSPDLMIVHDMSNSHYRKPLELRSFPPWQIRLTEFHYNRDLSVWRWWRRHDPSLLDESEFRQALDEFASAEMRLGK
ncbi:hypothetical protein K474DRAFT_1655664 [Panus rudis PR-1116 ss-1]|nr:hypothetical protein K474DRAFT_1655664 [Panus rudis PR-1116 ss-1]